MKILIINIKYLGDLIVSTPGLRALRKAYPEAEIVYLLRKGYEDVLSGNPNLNSILTFDPQLKGYSGLKNFYEGLKFIRKIRSEKFDVIIALHPGDRIAVWSWLSGALIRIAPKKQSFSFMFNRLVDVEEDVISYMEYYNQIFSAFAGKIISTKTEFFIPSEVKEWAKNLLKSKSISGGDVLIGIHPGASEPTKIWKKENFAELINILLQNENIKILLIEGPQDKNISRHIYTQVNNPLVITFVSDNIKKTAALIQNCNIFITHDTGTRHLSVAVDTPVLALLPEDNLKCWGFYNESNKHHYLAGRRYIPKESSNEPAFLDGIQVNEVYKKTGEILGLW